MKDEKKALITQIATSAAEKALENQTPTIAKSIADELDKRYYTKTQILITLLIALFSTTSAGLALWKQYPQIPQNILKPCENIPTANERQWPKTKYRGGNYVYREEM